MTTNEELPDADPDLVTDPWQEVADAARALLDAREDQMLTRVEWERLEPALAELPPR